jgi:hypothetical protein
MEWKMTNLQDGLKKLADDLAKASPPRYCEAHKPCDAKEHTQGYQYALTLFYVVFGSLIFGLLLMFGINLVLSDWLEAVPHIGYGTAVMGTASLYVLRLIAKL